MGRKIPEGFIKLDAFSELSRARSWDRWIGVGITPTIEVDYHGERISDGPMRDTLDASYNFVTPIPNQAPGISLGVQDILNRTRDGRRFYIAATWRNSVDTVGSGNLPMDITIGLSQGSRALPLVGVSIPFSDDLKLLVEDDGVRIASGIEFKPKKKPFGFRVIIRDQDVMIGANYSFKF